MKLQNKIFKSANQIEDKGNNKTEFEKYRKSNIFSEEKQNINVNKSRLTINSQTSINPVEVLKKKEVSAFNRRMKEFHNIDNFKEKDFSSIAILEKEFKSNNGLFNELPKKDFKKSRNLTALETSNTTNYMFDVNKSARDNFIKSMQSNIFNNDEKKKYPLKNLKKELKDKKMIENSFKKKFNRNTDLRHVSGEANRWVNTNTEILFSRLYDKNSYDTFYQKVKNKTLASKLDSEEVVKNYGSLSHRKQTQQTSIHEQDKKIYQIKEQMKNKYGSETKTKKAFDSISVLQDKDKYHKNLISSEKKAETETVVVQNVRDLSPNEIKKKFIDKGIHIFDMIVNQDITNDQKASISFKIRKNNEENKKQFEEIASSLNKNNGLQFIKKDSNLRSTKPQSMNFPSDIKWNDSRVKQIFKNNKEFNSEVVKIPGDNNEKSRNRKLAPDEKFNTHSKLPYDLKYKNHTLSNNNNMKSSSKKIDSISSRTNQRKKC